MSETEKTYKRFNVDQRIEHALLIISFFLLGLTGLPQKFPFSPISEFIIRFFGGIELVRVVHRFSAFVMMIQSLFHIIMIGYKVFVLRVKASMIPQAKDLFDAIGMLAYNLGFSKQRPKMPRYNFMEKAEYWALVWGTVIMGITGFMLWNPIATTKALPGQIIPAAKAAHGAEAVLAVLAIFLWHFYFVHLRGINWSIFTGRMPRHQMEDEHAEELEEMESGVEEEPIPTEVREKRQLIFFPAAVVTSLAFLFFVFYFVSYEETALTTIPPVQAAVTPYSPQTPTPLPTATQEPTSAVPAGEAASTAGEITWGGAIGELFKQKCAACHGVLGEFSAETYQSVLAGGKGGPGVIPGEPSQGTVIQVQETGSHAGQFTQQELELVKAWIAAGALE